MSLGPPVWIRAMLPNSVFVPRINALRLEMTCLHAALDLGGEAHIMTGALVDSGATNNFITPAFTKHLYLTPIKLLKPRTIRNIDGTTNQGGQINKYVDIAIQQHTEDRPWWTRPLTMRQQFYLADLGEDDVILGYPWLMTHY